jgi:hypothetical protein
MRNCVADTAELQKSSYPDILVRTTVLRGAGLLAIICAFLAGSTGCQDPQRRLLVLSSESGKLRGGEPVLGTGHEELCAKAIEAIVAGDSVAPYLSDLLMVGPGFAQAMAGDQMTFPYGKAMLITGDFGGRRSYFLSYGVMDDEVLTMLRSSEIRACFRGFVVQKAVPATKEEREMYYSLIGWEIAGQPVTVIREGTKTLLLQATEGKLHWIDRVDQYPVPSVAGSADEAFKLLESVNSARP